MTEASAGLARLREPFPAEHIGKLPRITCPQCSRAQGRCCNDHNKSKCSICDNWITERHIHLDYCGHGAVTDRLLEVDETYDWQPLAFDDAGMPTFVYDRDMNPVRFWIKLTVLGVTRLGVGTCESGQFDAEKVLIGDALRNAAMRFGVALDLWIKGHAEDDERTTATSERRQQRAPEPTEPAISKPKLDQIMATLATFDEDTIEKLKGWVAAKKMPEHPRQLTEAQADEVIAHMATLAPETPAGPADEEPFT